MVRAVIFLDIDGVIQPLGGQRRFRHDLEKLREDLAARYKNDEYLEMDNTTSGLCITTGTWMLSSVYEASVSRRMPRSSFPRIGERIRRSPGSRTTSGCTIWIDTSSERYLRYAENRGAVK